MSHQIQEDIPSPVALEGTRMLDITYAAIDSLVGEKMKALDTGELAKAVALKEGLKLLGVELFEHSEGTRWKLVSP